MTSYNPLAMENLAHSIVTRMMESEPTPLGDLISKPSFPGSGVYAIFYQGDFPAYAALAAANLEGATVPIYVGKAVPKGGRKGVNAASGTSEPQLRKRLREHAKSVEAAGNLDIDHFSARWLVVDDIWIPLGESALLREHRPVWNALVDGFGNHDPGSGRGAGIRSRWDTLHPGRAFAPKYPPRPETAADIEQDVKEYLRQRL